MIDGKHVKKQIHLTKTEARASTVEAGGVVRKVLVITTLLVVILFTVIVLVGRP